MPDMVQSVMEGVGFAFADCCRALEQCGSLPERVCVAGGGSQSETWLQMIADITGLTLDVPESGAQGAALGAARLAMLGSSDAAQAEVRHPPKLRKSIAPNPALEGA